MLASAISQILREAQLNFWSDLENIKLTTQLKVLATRQTEFTQSQTAIQVIRPTFSELPSDD